MAAPGIQAHTQQCAHAAAAAVQQRRVQRRAHACAHACMHVRLHARMHTCNTHLRRAVVRRLQGTHLEACALKGSACMAPDRPSVLRARQLLGSPSSPSSTPLHAALTPPYVCPRIGAAWACGSMVLIKGT